MSFFPLLAALALTGPAAAAQTPEDFAPVPESPEEANDTVHRALAYLAGAKKSMEE